jgi:exodeoxyribonuclease VII large subunit
MEIAFRMSRDLESRVRSAQQDLDGCGTRMAHAVHMRRQSAAQDVKRVGMQLSALNPLAVLRRGYSITSRTDGKIVRSLVGIRAGQRLLTRLTDGTMESEVTALRGMEGNNASAEDRNKAGAAKEQVS